jgi:hypothetical protein
MEARVGDRLVIKGHTLGEPDRDGEILEVHGADGTAPYLVQWSDDGHVGLVFPGPDAQVDHLVHDDAINGDGQVAAAP